MNRKAAQHLFELEQRGEICPQYVVPGRNILGNALSHVCLDCGHTLEAHYLKAGLREIEFREQAIHEALLSDERITDAVKRLKELKADFINPALTVIESADNTGCSDDLTVVSREALSALEAIVAKHR